MKNRQRIVFELPPAMVEWLQARSSSKVWHCIANDLAVETAEILLVNQGEAGQIAAIHHALCQHTSRAVRSLAQSTRCRGRRWYAKSVAVACARYFGVSTNTVYLELRWRRKRVV